VQRVRIDPGQQFDVLDNNDVRDVVRTELDAYRAATAPPPKTSLDIECDPLNVEPGSVAALRSGGAAVGPASGYVWHVRRVSTLGGPVRLYANTTFRAVIGGTVGDCQGFDLDAFVLSAGLTLYVRNHRTSNATIGVNLAVTSVRVK
jgi:hypothetical protein